MLAAQITEFNAPLTLGQVADPVCPVDGVVLRVLACGVCRSDWHAWNGSDPDVKLGQIPGHEYCGEVIETGAQCRDWKVGDRVIAPFILACNRCPSCAAGHQTTCPTQAVPGFTHPGAFAEYIAVPQADGNLARLPDSIDVTLAAALGCRTTTAWHALTDRAALAPGEWVAVFGTGGVGLSALLLAKAIGARVICVDIVPEKLSFAKSLGADHVVNSAEADAPAAIRDLTGGGAHLAIEALGIETTTRAAMQCLRKLGRMVQVGMPAGKHTEMTLPMDALYSGQLALFGTRGMPGWRYPSLLNMIDAGQVDLSPLVAREITLSQASDEVAAFNGLTPPGVAVITDFSR
ncbi:zinc-dependent alcohol dehydrogenase family protein [Halocynthiibacter styelae]|uniref:Zinc-dependent alcohol dehydrogenase family protein n=1 Tax=Halocynthiibacter styelae TaxID=2761955 RepID=A0A8J7IWL0_9RHOB|nr:zinc-dependent alcohol dehydrogenase family protein [Paenihalocynthiibacter styelae]MBI1494178.1 zinc-dependent alcohol dehydrogenase family protein [Paenihalocynthiibacter styelae]